MNEGRPANRIAAAGPSIASRPGNPVPRIYDRRVTDREIPVLLNVKAHSVRKNGADATLGRVVDAFRAANLVPRVEALSPEAVEAALRAAVTGGAQTVVVGGGDGTLRTAADVLAGTDVALGILQLGRHNHGARDLCLAPDLGEAARTVARGVVRRVDVATLDGRAFLNNSVLGVYPYLVRVRERHERRFRLSRLSALMRAAWKTFWRYPMLQVDFPGSREFGSLRTPLVFVGNNEYSMGLELGRRRSLEEGTLWLCAVLPMGRLRLLRLAVRSLFVPEPRPEDVLTIRSEEISVDLGSATSWVSLDGEVRRASGMLKYRIRPGALRVLVKPPEGSVRDS